MLDQSLPWTTLTKGGDSFLLKMDILDRRFILEWGRSACDACYARGSLRMLISGRHAEGVPAPLHDSAFEHLGPFSMRLGITE